MPYAPIPCFSFSNVVQPGWVWLVMLFLLPWWALGQSDEERLLTPFEQDTMYSAHFTEAHDWYLHLAESSPLVTCTRVGESDGWLPIYSVVISGDGETDPVAIRASGRAVVLINNAIHPGEPAGVDASMMLARDLVQDPVCKAWLQDVVVVIIPYYNVDGGRNRSATYRANQSGPREQGFRGNARNLDLNRDFIKCDSRNARTFSRVFHHWDPDVFVDTHTSNGADYPYTITVIPTQPDKLPTALAQYQEERLLPRLYQHMEQVGWPMCPYVHSDGPPDRGILGFLDLPRYSTGYTALFQTIGFMPETHMLKPFADRVRSTRAFLDGVLSIVAAQRTALLTARRMARHEVREQICWPLHWTLDTSRTESLPFHGYSAEMVRSQVHGQPRLRYDREKTYHQEIPYLPHYRPTLTVDQALGICAAPGLGCCRRTSVS